MNTPTGMPERPVTAPKGWRNRRTLGIALGVGVILLIVCAAAYYFISWRHSTISNGASAVIAPDGLPLFEALGLNTATGALSPLTVEGQGTAVLIDESVAKDSSYYLIADQGMDESNLYSLDAVHPEAGLDQLTSSHTLKFGLSYDAVSGSAAYMTGNQDESSHVVVYDAASKKEVDLGEGADPALLPGGFFVVMRRGGQIMSVEVASGTTHDLLSIDAGAAFAVDPSSMKVTLYSPETSLVQVFSIATSIAASYVSSVSSPARPQAFAFDGTDILAISSDHGQSVLTSLTSSTTPRTISQPLPARYRLSFVHD